MDSLSLPWLGASDLLEAQVGADDGKGEGELKFPYVLGRQKPDENG